MMKIKNVLLRHKHLPVMAALFGGVVIGAVAHGASTLLDTPVAVAGELPPPGITVPNSVNVGSGCDQNQQTIGLQNAQNQISQFAANQAQSTAASNALSSCFSNFANLGIPGLVGFNMGQMLSALQNSACNLAQGEIQQQIAPVYGLAGRYSPQSLVNQATGTISNNGAGGQLVGQTVSSGITGPTTNYTVGNLPGTVTSLFK